MSREYRLRKGVVPIHLFNKVWRIGRLRENKKNIAHVVIYGPENQEYDVYGDDAINLFDMDSEYSWFRKRPNRPDRAAVKIYILTSILDNRENWNFDLKSKPKKGETIKVIYDNGTIKNIEFSGEWESLIIQKKYPSINNPKDFWTVDKEIHPITWKVK